MKHYTRRERKIRRNGYNDGYIEGYKQGLHDGNPLIAIAEAAAKAVNSIIETIDDPKFQEACREYLEEQKKDSHKGNCDFCKHQDRASTEYPCCVCGDGENFFEMWEEEENDSAETGSNAGSENDR